jgi:hypothetical protein
VSQTLADSTSGWAVNHVTGVEIAGDGSLRLAGDANDNFLVKCCP